MFFFIMFFYVTQIITIETPYQVKEEEDNAMHSTVVIFSSNDNFTLKQVQFCFTQYNIHIVSILPAAFKL